MGEAERSVASPPRSPTAAEADSKPRARAIVAWVTTVVACLLVWVALTAPDPINGQAVTALVRIPLEGLLVVAVLLVLPRVDSGWLWPSECSSPSLRSRRSSTLPSSPLWATVQPLVRRELLRAGCVGVGRLDRPPRCGSVGGRERRCWVSR